jgi:hypothetical protein
MHDDARGHNSRGAEANRQLHETRRTVTFPATFQKVARQMTQRRGGNVMATYLCALCGLKHPDEASARAHLALEHGISQAHLYEGVWHGDRLFVRDSRGHEAPVGTAPWLAYVEQQSQAELVVVLDTPAM